MYYYTIIKKKLKKKKVLKYNNCKKLIDVKKLHKIN